MPDILGSLIQLGLNPSEAELYAYLVAQPGPVTAYRAGRALGKATANVYKAMESLALKGAVTVEEGEPRLCRAAPPEEFLGQLEQQFQSRKLVAATELAKLGTTPAEERIYRLESVPLVLERARAMLARAERVALVDAFPRTLASLAEAIAQTAARGVEVKVLAYEPTIIPGARITAAPRGATALSFWRSQQLNLVIDGQEALLALVSDDLSQVLQALWTDNLYLSCLLHAGLGMEQTFHAIESLRATQDLPPELLALLDQQSFFFNTHLPGQRRLMARHGKGQPEENR